MENKGFIFVLMPFADTYNDIYHYGIKKTINECGYYCERVDEQTFEGTILSRIYNQIQKADLVISDMTDRNPNVFYETGYAHALQKKVILLTQKEDDIPFDLKHYPHVIYNGNIKFLADELGRKINWYSKHDKQKFETSYFLEIFNEGNIVIDNSIVTGHRIEVLNEDFDDLSYKNLNESEKKKLKSNAVYSLKLEFYNKGTSDIDDINEIALILENSYKNEEVFLHDFFTDKISKLPNNKVLLKLDSFTNSYDGLHPQSWDSTVINLGRRRHFQKIPKEATLRLFTKSGIRDTSFQIKFKSSRINEDL